VHAEEARAAFPREGTRRGGGAVARFETMNYLLGKENFKSPEELKRDLEYAAELGELQG